MRPSLGAQTLNAELDVIDSRFAAVKASTLTAFATSIRIIVRGNSRMRRSWALMLAFSLLRILLISSRRTLPGKMMLGIQARRAACSSGVAAA